MNKMVNIYNTLDRGRTIQKWLPVIMEWKPDLIRDHKLNILLK